MYVPVRHGGIVKPQRRHLSFWRREYHKHGTDIRYVRAVQQDRERSPGYTDFIGVIRGQLYITARFFDGLSTPLVHTESWVVVRVYAAYRFWCVQNLRARDVPFRVRQNPDGIAGAS